MNRLNEEYEELHPKIYAFFYAKAGNQATAQDLCHDTFYEACKNIASFNNHSTLSTYLFYRSVLIAVLLAGVPNFIWNCLLYMTDLLGEFYAGSFWEALQLALFSLTIYLIFTIIGIVIGFCILKIMEENEL